jgi:hypothetical protein
MFCHVERIGALPTGPSGSLRVTECPEDSIGLWPAAATRALTTNATSRSFSLGGEATLWGELAKRRTIVDRGRIEPGAQERDRGDPPSVGNDHQLALPKLIGFREGDQDLEAGRNLPTIDGLRRDQFGATEGAIHADRHQRAVADTANNLALRSRAK